MSKDKDKFLKNIPKWLYESYFKKGYVTQEDCSWLVRLGYGYVMAYAYDNGLVVM